MKKCSTCKLEKSLSEFRKDTSRKDGIHCTCNSCNKLIQKKWYERNKEQARIISNNKYHTNREVVNSRRKILREKNKAKISVQKKKHYAENPSFYRELSWKNAGIVDMTVSRYDQLFISQKGCCAICNTHQNELKRRLNVDHNHQTGQVRGLLCDICNRGLGYLKDSVEILSSAKIYLTNGRESK
jgi:23S rRNA G2069 N7-methylase RlmK/C1962 C5-methylase RlmI